MAGSQPHSNEGTRIRKQDRWETKDKAKGMYLTGLPAQGQMVSVYKNIKSVRTIEDVKTCPIFVILNMEIIYFQKMHKISFGLEC